MRLADLASILAQGCTLWTDSFKLSGTPTRSGGFRFYKNTPNTGCPVLGVHIIFCSAGICLCGYFFSAILLFQLPLHRSVKPAPHTAGCIAAVNKGANQSIYFSSICLIIILSRLILLKRPSSADIRPVPHVALPRPIIACCDNRPVRFQSDRVIIACRDGHDIRPVPHVA